MPTRYRGSARETRALETYVKFVRASSSLESLVRHCLAEQDLTPSQLGILEAIYHLGPLKQKEIAAKMLMSGGNITRVIDNLEKSGLVTRIACEDRRAFEITLTPRGKKFIGGLFPAHVSNITRALGVLNAEEQKTLARLCKKLGTGIEAL